MLAIKNLVKLERQDLPIILELFVSNYISSTSSECCGIPYYFGLNVYGECYYGREFTDLIDALDRISTIGEDIIIYSFDLRYLYGYFDSVDLKCKSFETNSGRLIKFECENFIFKSIRSLSGAHSFEQFNDLVLSRMDLEYERAIKTSETKLKRTEYRRMEKCLEKEYNYILRTAEEEGGLSNIPLTLSGLVKKKLKSSCLGSTDKSRRVYQKKLGYFDYKDGADTLPLRTVEHFNFMRKCFSGGFVGYNIGYKDCTMNNVGCFDFTSSYVARLCMYKYPMEFVTSYTNVDDDYASYLLNKFWCACCIDLRGLRSKSACKPLKISELIDDRRPELGVRSISLADSLNVVEEDGFVVSADFIRVFVTNSDLDYLSWFYDWDDVSYNVIEAYNADYLPEEYIRVVLQLFKDKSLNKKNPDNFIETRSKAMLNITWGLFVSGFYGHTDEELQKTIDDYDSFRGSFGDRCSAYQWGIACTSYARRDLLNIVKVLGDDWLYSDTDSVYFILKDEYLEFINRFNDWTTAALLRNPYLTEEDICVKSNFCNKYYNLGHLICDGEYEKFKFLKNKTYLKYNKEGYKLCISGCSNFRDSFFETVDDPFEWFTVRGDVTNLATIPSKFCDNFTRYIHFNDINICIKDYTGISRRVVLPGGYYREFTDFRLMSVGVYEIMSMLDLV